MGRRRRKSPGADAPQVAGAPPPARSRARRKIVVAGAVAVVALGAAFFLARSWLRRTPDSAVAAHEAAALAPADEFRPIADRLFNKPGGQMDRTKSRVLRQRIAEAGGDAQQLVTLRAGLVKALLADGDARGAVDEVESLFEAVKSETGVGAGPGLHEIRGLAYLRLAEVENCIERHNEDCCVFPLAGGGVHAKKSSAERAAASYLEYLRQSPDDLTIRWLLNITHMAMGTYPGSVPDDLLVPLKGPNSSEDFPRFEDVAVSCGIAKLNHAGGVVMDDLDGDGLLDILVSSIAPDVPLAFYRNTGDGAFEDRTAQAGLLDQLGGLNLVSADYDNDGDLDVLVLRGAWLFGDGRIRNSLLRNDGAGRFTDVTREAKLAEPACPTQVGVWFDYDNDGDLDLYVGNESRSDPVKFPGIAGEDFPCNLFRNEGNGTFTDVATAAGVTNDRFTKGATAGDFDGDGWMDLYVSNMGPNRLYRNEGNGTFRDVAETLGVAEPVGNSFVPWFFDVDNDGDLDIFVGGYDSERENIGDVAAWLLRRPFSACPPRLYRNQGDGTFEDVTRTAELWRPMAPMGANFGDLDNDGWLDMYFATGAPRYDYIVPNVMLRNAGGRHFVDVTVAGGFGDLQKGHGVAFGDLDHDGDQDVFNQVGGFLQGDAFYNSLYENPGFQNRFIVLDLVGRRSNRMGWGARIQVNVATPQGPRAIHRAAGSVGSFGCSPKRQEIGLGDATSITSVEIWWPASGTRQTLTRLGLDAFYRVTEGSGAAETLAPPRLRLGKR